MKEDEIKVDANKEGENDETAKEKEEKQTEEEDQKEIELSAAEYLALLRETEMSLYRATLSHEKVSTCVVRALT